MMLSIATAVLGFASTPHDHCVGGHTGNLAFGGTVGISCDTPDLKCYNHDDGSEAWGFEFAGSMYKTSDVCPQACGTHCGYAPSWDAPDETMTALFGVTCAQIKDHCEFEMALNWLCGETCRGGGKWDECHWHNLYSSKGPAHAQWAEECTPWDTMGGMVNTTADMVNTYYTSVEECLADGPNWTAETYPPSCPGDPSGTNCVKAGDIYMQIWGSTEVHKCYSYGSYGSYDEDDGRRSRVRRSLKSTPGKSFTLKAKGATA